MLMTHLRTTECILAGLTAGHLLSDDSIGLRSRNGSAARLQSVNGTEARRKAENFAHGAEFARFACLTRPINMHYLSCSTNHPKSVPSSACTYTLLRPGRLLVRWSFKLTGGTNTA